MDLDVPEIRGLNGSAWMDKFEGWMRRGVEHEKVMSDIRLAQVKGDVTTSGTKSINGLGEQYAVMDARTYLRWQQEDQHFWDDAANVKKFFKDNDKYLLDGKKV